MQTHRSNHKTFKQFSNKKQRTNLPQQKQKGSLGFFFAHRKKQTTGGGGGGVALNIHDEIKHTNLHGQNTTTFVTKNPKKSSVVTPQNPHHLPPPPLRLFHDGSFTSRSQQKRFYNNNTKYSTNQNSKHMWRRFLFSCFSCSILQEMQIRRRKRRRFIKTKTKKKGSPCFLFFSNFSRRACLRWYWTRTKDEWLKLPDRQKKRCRHHRKLPREN